MLQRAEMLKFYVPNRNFDYVRWYTMLVPKKVSLTQAYKNPYKKNDKEKRARGIWYKRYPFV